MEVRAMDSIEQTADALKRVYHERRPAEYWFSPDTMRFFGTRIGKVVQVGQVWLFITSEKPPHGPRAYSVRRMTETGDISTVGEFCVMTRGQAPAALRDAVADEVAEGGT
jgi:hypothetical protein